MKHTVLIVVLITLCQTPIHFAQNAKRPNSQDVDIPAKAQRLLMLVSRSNHGNLMYALMRTTKSVQRSKTKLSMET